MESSTPYGARNRKGGARILTAEEAQQRADELFASAELLPVGNARTAVLKEAFGFRTLAQMKQFIATPPRPGRPAK